MDELKQWLADNPRPKGQKTFHSLELPEHMVSIMEQVLGNNRQEHPDNAEVMRLGS